MRVALIGDYSASVKAHQAIPLALTLACESRGCAAEWQWLHTATLPDDPSEQLAPFHGIWCVPASPYANTRGAIAAIRNAREHRKPFLGTCGGFQHALLEYAEAVWGIARPIHAELDPHGADPVIAPLECSLVEQADDVRFDPTSKLSRIYRAESAHEEYHCRYGLSRHYCDRLASGPLRASAWDSAGDVRAVELDGHPFFIATLFQPERSALGSRRHPLIRAFVDAVDEHTRHRGGR
jgi:CTP synthase (UTP-ammonia lyase)